MKKITLVWGLLCALTLLGCSPQEPASSANTASKKTAADNQITVGVDDSFAPMSFRNDKNQLEGFDIDLAREAAKRLRLTVEFVAIDWIDKEAALNNKRVDALWSGLAVTPERQTSMALTQPYLRNRQIIAVQQGSNLKEHTDLAGKAVGVQDGSNALAAVRKQTALWSSFQPLRTFGDPWSALLQLSGSRLDAVVLDEVVARYYITRPLVRYSVLDSDLGSEDYAVGLRTDDSALRDQLNQVLTEMQRDGTTKKLSQRWFAKDLTP